MRKPGTSPETLPRFALLDETPAKGKASRGVRLVQQVNALGVPPRGLGAHASHSGNPICQVATGMAFPFEHDDESPGSGRS